MSAPTAQLSPEYLQALIEGLQKQRDLANNQIAHLAAQHVEKDNTITALKTRCDELQREVDSFRQQAGIEAAKS